MESKESDELNALSPQVLDYYQKYSQTRNLPSYLRGPVISNSDNQVDLPNAGQTENIRDNVQLPQIGDDNDENNINTGNIIDTGQFPSPTSSVISSRKLEWDNLGDIGYGNCVKQKSLHKSLSLPILTTLEKINLGQKLPLNLEEGIIDDGGKVATSLRSSSHESTGTDGDKKVSSFTSTNTTSSKKIPTLSDTTSYSSFSKFKTITTETDLSDVDCTVLDNNGVNNFKKYVGLPMAESTPNTAFGETNLIRKDCGNVKLDNDVKEEPVVNKVQASNLLHKDQSAEIELKCVATCLRNNIKHLSLTKPILVECYNDKKILDKDIQTSILTVDKKSTVATQTEKNSESDQIIDSKIHPVLDERRIVEYIKYGDSPNECSMRSMGTNTNSSIISQCSSFEHHYVNLSEPSKLCSSKSSGDLNKDKQTHDKGNPEKVAAASDNENTVSCVISDSSSIANSLAELISTKLSKHVIGDVDKSITILQKLLKSKKYDRATKQYYVKKIAQKIVKYNYSSESSIHSEITTETTNENYKDSDDKIEHVIEASTSKNEYQKAVPQKPVIINENNISEKPKQLEIKTFSTEILPEEPIMDNGKNKQVSKVKDARFTITGSYINLNPTENICNMGDADTVASPISSPYSPIESSTTSQRSDSFKNWKENMTKSEMLLDEKISKLQNVDDTSNNSELLNFAKKERENQIHWINNEINHLNKLKNMLQTREQKQQVNIKAFTEPRVEDMGAINKTTSVYVITTQKSNVSSSSTYRSSIQSSATKSLSKKCECLFSKSGSLPCDSSDCPVLNLSSDKSFKTNDFNKMLKKDIRMLPHLTNFPEFQSDNDIANAKLIANEIYPGHAPDTCVRRFVFEVPLNLQDDVLKEKYERLLREQPAKPFIPKLPDCNINMDSQNAKLLASEICEGSRPNTCVRRYVFEIPVRGDDASIGKRSKSKGSTPVSYSKKLSSSRETASSKFIPGSKCKCKTKPTVKSCMCTQIKNTTGSGICDPKSYKPSDLSCTCQIGESKKDDWMPCKICKKSVETEICSDPSRKYRICVEQIGIGDSECKCECTCPKCKQKLHDKAQGRNQDYSSSDNVWPSEQEYKQGGKQRYEEDKNIRRFKRVEIEDEDVPADNRHVHYVVNQTDDKLDYKQKHDKTFPNKVSREMRKFRGEQSKYEDVSVDDKLHAKYDDSSSDEKLDYKQKRGRTSPREIRRFKGVEVEDEDLPVDNRQHVRYDASPSDEKFNYRQKHGNTSPVKGSREIRKFREVETKNEDVSVDHRSRIQYSHAPSDEKMDYDQQYSKKPPAKTKREVRRFEELEAGDEERPHVKYDRSSSDEKLDYEQKPGRSSPSNAAREKRKFKGVETKDKDFSVDDRPYGRNPNNKNVDYDQKYGKTAPVKTTRDIRSSKQVETRNEDDSADRLHVKHDRSSSDEKLDYEQKRGKTPPGKIPREMRKFEGVETKDEDDRPYDRDPSDENLNYDRKHDKTAPTKTSREVRRFRGIETKNEYVPDDDKSHAKYNRSSSDEKLKYEQKQGKTTPVKTSHEIRKFKEIETKYEDVPVDDRPHVKYNRSPSDEKMDYERRRGKISPVKISREIREFIEKETEDKDVPIDDRPHTRFNPSPSDEKLDYEQRRGKISPVKTSREIREFIEKETKGKDDPVDGRPHTRFDRSPSDEKLDYEQKHSKTVPIKTSHEIRRFIEEETKAGEVPVDDRSHVKYKRSSSDQKLDYEQRRENTNSLKKIRETREFGGIETEDKYVPVSDRSPNDEKLDYEHKRSKTAPVKIPRETHEIRRVETKDKDASIDNTSRVIYGHPPSDEKLDYEQKYDKTVNISAKISGEKGSDPREQGLSVQTTSNVNHKHKLITAGNNSSEIKVYEKPTSSANRAIHLIISCDENGPVVRSDGDYFIKDSNGHPKKKEAYRIISAADDKIEREEKPPSSVIHRSKTEIKNETTLDSLSDRKKIKTSLPIKENPKKDTDEKTRHHDLSSKKIDERSSTIKHKLQPGAEKKPAVHDKRKDKQLSSVKHRPKSEVDDKTTSEYLSADADGRSSSRSKHKSTSGTDSKTVSYPIPDTKKEKLSSVSYKSKLVVDGETTSDYLSAIAEDKSSSRSKQTSRSETDSKTISYHVPDTQKETPSSPISYNSKFEADRRSKYRYKSVEEKTTSDDRPISVDDSLSSTITDEEALDSKRSSNKNGTSKTETKSSEQKSSRGQSGTTEMLEARFPTAQIFKVPAQHVAQEKHPMQNIVLVSPEKRSQHAQSTNTDEKAKESKDNHEDSPDQNNKIVSRKSTKREAKKSEKNKGEPTSSSSSASDSTDSSESSEKIPRICLCCNRAEAKFRSKLRGLPYQLSNALCDPCYISNRQTDTTNCRPYYTYPGHVCNCYTVMKTETIRNIQRTVQELEDLERERDFCPCSYGYRTQNYGDKRGRRKKSIAYTLTFEDMEKSASDEEDKKYKKSPLEEIRIKIPKFVKKSLKDRENKKRSKHEKRDHRHRRKDQNSKTFTLQDHLLANRPNFIASAEERRKALIELAYMREERCQKYKQLLAMSNGILPERNIRNKTFKPKMFTSKEMKDMTAKKYKKLPEVQKKLEENRKEQIKKANKILTNIFNKRLQGHALKGKVNLSTSTSVIKLP